VGKVGEIVTGMKYTREQLAGYFAWDMIGCLKHFPNDHNVEDEAKAFAFSRPRANGFITFQTKYRGKRFIWISNGEVEELEPIEAYLRTLPTEKTREEFKNEPSDAFKKRISNMLFGEKTKKTGRKRRKNTNNSTL
jgi:hypothetical protein